MEIAVVVLNYNGRDLLRKYLPALIKNSEGASLVVIDNASTDESVAVLTEEFPEVKRIINPKNTGYAGGYNEGLKSVDADVYVLINSDVEVTPNWLVPIRDAFLSDSKLGAVQPAILSDERREFYEYAGAAGGFIDALGYPFCRGRVFDTLEKNEGQYEDSIDCFWASGACMAVRSEVFHKLDGFYDHYFAHMEEIDLCWRMKSEGFTIKCLPQSKVYHLGGGTLSYQNSRKMYLNFRNNLIMLGRNLPSSQLIPVIFFRMILDGISAFRFLLGGKFSFFGSVIRAHIDFYFHFSNIRKYRKDRKPKWKSLSGRYAGLVVLDYFAKGKKKFSDIVSR
ncbi:MAG: glycosyltransferase family 2 protein [Cryomorphaceae bacterium]|nr:glycosyltransferase family 2 protein [Cryomorphaceae bacterium]